MRGAVGAVLSGVVIAALGAPTTAAAQPSTLEGEADTYFVLSANSIDRTPHDIVVRYDVPTQRFFISDTAGITSPPIVGPPSPGACVQTSPTDVNCPGPPPLSGIGEAVIVEGGAGPDKINLLSLGPANQFSILDGGRGADTLGAGGEGDVRGGDGDDRIFGSRQADRLHAEGGDDLIVGGKGSDKMNGGPGIDTIKAKDGVKDITIRCFGGSNLIERATRDPFDPPARSC